MKVFHNILFIGILINAVFSGQAQNFSSPSNKQFKNFSVSNGLSQSTVNCIFQDSIGYLWFGTRAGGLNRFDGYSFTHYNRNTYGSDVLLSDEIICITEGNSSDLFFGTEDAGIYLLNRKASVIQHFYLEESALCMYFEKTKENLWIGTNKGLIIKSTKDNKVKVTHLLKDEIIINIVSKNQQNIFITTNLHVYIFDANAKIKTKINLESIKRKANETNHSTCTDVNQTTWLVNNTGLWKIPFGKNQKITNEKLFKNIPGFEDATIKTILCDSKNFIWIGTNKGLIFYNPYTKNTKIYTNQINNINSLTHNSVYSLLEDSEKNIWVGTWSGISMLSDKLTKFEHVRHINFLSNSLSNNMVSSFAEDKNGIWIGTEQGGLNYMNNSTKNFDHFIYSDNKSLDARDHIKCLYTDKRYHLWIGTFGAGIRKKNPITGIETPYLPGKKVFAITEFPKGILWVGTISGLIKMHVAGNSIKTYQTDTIKPGSLHNNFITALYTSNKNELWVGTRKGGVALYLPDVDDFNVFRKNQNNQDMESDYIICITEDADGTPWIGTDFGLYYFDRGEKTFKKASYLMELQNYLINGIAFDTENNIWVSTNNGIFKYDRQAKELHKFKLSDGLQSFEFNRGAYFTSLDGSLFFGGINGFNIVHPNQFSLNQHNSKPVIQSVKTVSGTINLEYQKNNALKLAYNQNDLEIKCTALSFINPEDNNYSYKLRGYNDNWSEPGKNRTFTFTNLSPDNYEFMLKVSNNDNVWNNKISALTIEIKPPYWKTVYAYLFYAFVVALIIYFIRKEFLSRQQQKMQLEYERNQKKQIQELNEMKLRYFTNISHEFRTPLTLIKGPLTELGKELKNEETKNKLTIINRNTNRLLNLINQLLDFRKVEKDVIEPSVSEGNLNKFVSEIISDFEHQAAEQKISLNYIYKENTVAKSQWFDPYILDKIIFNLLSNAIKFTPEGGTIEVILKIDQQEATLIIEDNGEGIKKEDLNKIFDRFYSSKNLMKHNFSGSGIGLALSKRLIEIHKGSISVESEPGKGTRFTVNFPVDKNAYESFIKTSIDVLKTKDNSSLIEEKSKIKKNHTVLIVEDNAELREYLSKIFHPHCQVKTAENGEEALKMSSDSQIDLIISDIMMPIMDGIELSKKIHTNMATSHIPIIFLTAKSGAENETLGLSTGAIDYITKPFNPEDLIAKANNILSNRDRIFKKLISSQPITEDQSQVLSLDEKFLKLTYDAIRDNYSNPDFKVENLVDIVHLSRSQVHRKFKSLTGKSPSEVLIDIRLTKAKELIETKSMNISEVAYQTGYNNLSVFSQAFKNKFGVSPSEV